MKPKKYIKFLIWILAVVIVLAVCHCTAQQNNNIHTVQQNNDILTVQQNYNIPTGQQNNDIRVCVLTTYRTVSEELQAIKRYLNRNEFISFEVLNLDKASLLPSQIEDFHILWYQQLDENSIPAILAREQNINTIKHYIKNGGTLFLTMDAVKYISNLHLETKPPEISYTRAIDHGYGCKRGLHACRYHPVFDRLTSGAFIFSPPQDTTVRQIGYFDNNDEIHAAVVAVDWAYIKLMEHRKLVLEYRLGEGKVLTAGAYIQLSMPNHYRQHLEKMLDNIMRYLASDTDTKKYYWYTAENISLDNDFSLGSITFQPPSEWNELTTLLNFQHTPGNHFWDLAGERILLMGKENEGVEEVWAHPFMALRDYTIGYRCDNMDNIKWLKGAAKRIRIEPHAVVRTYEAGNNNILKETITVDKKEPVAVLHYHYYGSENIEFFISYQTNMRLMWPYSSAVTGKILYQWDDNSNACIFTDLSKDLVSIIGSNKKPADCQVGPCSIIDNRDVELTNVDRDTVDRNTVDRDTVNQDTVDRDTVYQDTVAQDTVYQDTLLVKCLMQYDIKGGDKFDIVIGATGEGVDQTYSSYKSFIQNPQNIYRRSFEYYRGFLSSHLKIETPDSVFNTSYLWALIGTDRFMVRTPGVGKSLVAGYATTARGWDGGHAVNGRPGYGWYFGRDAQWSGFALDNYGDLENTRCILKNFVEFQDINGKIYHEMSTSGVIHYDAADATPLFVVLAGHYLRHSGDVDWVKDNWRAIRKAIDFCFSTDSNGDHLIENKGVGHGWVEGGHLFGGISTLYLSSCWAAALEEASYMAYAIGKDSLSKSYSQEKSIVTGIINSTFWNPETRVLNHSLNEDGSFIDDVTIMPAIPLYFEQVEGDKILPMLELFNHSTFSADWGVRIVNKENERYNPGGYHTGSVWPLYTGWTALAEFKNNRPVQGFSHTMNNLLIYDDWASGFMEEVLHGHQYKPFGVCPHQCWSETMGIQPLIEGMLGYQPDAVNNRLELSPYFPVHWDVTDIANLRFGDQYIDITYQRTEKDLLYSFAKEADKKIKFYFKPVLPAGTKINEVFVNSKKHHPLITKKGEFVVPLVRFNLQNKAVIRILYAGGIGVIPPIYNPQPGDTSGGLRIISSTWKEKGKTYLVKTEGPAGLSRSFHLWINQWEIGEISGGELLQKNDRIHTIRVLFDNRDKGVFVTKEIEIKITG